MNPESNCVSKNFSRAWGHLPKTTNTQRTRKFWKDLAHHRRRRAVAHNLHHLDDENYEVVPKPVTDWDVY